MTDLPRPRKPETSAIPKSTDRLPKKAASTPADPLNGDIAQLVERGIHKP